MARMTACFMSPVPPVSASWSSKDSCSGSKSSSYCSRSLQRYDPHRSARQPVLACVRSALTALLAPPGAAAAGILPTDAAAGPPAAAVPDSCHPPLLRSAAHQQPAARLPEQRPRRHRRQPLPGPAARARRHARSLRRAEAATHGEGCGRSRPGEDMTAEALRFLFVCLFFHCCCCFLNKYAEFFRKCCSTVQSSSERNLLSWYIFRSSHVLAYHHMTGDRSPLHSPSHIWEFVYFHPVLAHFFSTFFCL